MARRRKHQLPKIVWGLIIVLTVGVVVVGGSVWQQRQQLIRDTTNALNQSKAKAKEEAALKRHFITRLAPYAQQLYGTYHILPSITLAQAALESDWGRSSLAATYHNLFGIKGTDPATTKLLKTSEYVNGQWVTVRARFQVYASDQASMKAHSLLLVNGTSWNANQYAAVVSAKTYTTAAEALKTAGYATDPGYPEKLINLIKQYDLAKYDQ